MTRHYSNSKRPLLLHRQQVIEHWTELKSKGVDDNTLQAVLKISRATFYRWNRSYKSHGLYGLMPRSKRPLHIGQPTKLTNDIIAKIRAFREQHPFFGKVKIHALCIKQGISISQASVGRALHYLMQCGIITPVVVLKGHKERKFIRKFTDTYSKRLPKYHKAPIQIDHTIINLRGTEHRVFVAYDRASKFCLCKSYKQATSDNAALFLDYIIPLWPYIPSELQVDGGSEFRGCFESACKNNRIKLFVLPPRTPQLNAGVERYNQTLQDEFFLPNYNTLPTDTDMLNSMLSEWSIYYNEFRPHRSLLDKYGIPIPPKRFLQSHMS